MHTHDPVAALSFAAAATKKIKLGTGICLIPQHDPIITAKQVASLDQLSGGRFIFAMGGGWNVDARRAADTTLAQGTWGCAPALTNWIMASSTTTLRSSAESASALYDIRPSALSAT